MLSLLRHNCQPYPNVVIHPQAVGTKSGCGPLYRNNISSVCSTLHQSEIAYPGVEWTPLNVDIVGVNSIVDLSPDVLKIDVEGLEGALVHSIGSAVERTQIIYVEFHAEHLRIELDRMLLRTHALCYARILDREQGELTYVKRS